MRITEHRMIELASDSIARSRERVAQAGDQLSSGERVSRPSQDPAAWAGARRADAERTLNDGRGDALARSQERLSQTDGALAQIGDSLQRARELALAAANETMGPDQLAAFAAEVHGLRLTALAAANTRTSDGEYILGGSQSGQAPFDATGAYLGDGATRQIESQSGLELPITLSGQVLTADSGVDVIGQLFALEAALSAGDRTGISATIDSLDAAHKQVSAARAEGGAESASLLDAQDVQRELDVSLAALSGRLVGADPVAAASELAQSGQTLEASQAVAARIVELTRP